MEINRALRRMPVTGLDRMRSSWLTLLMVMFWLGNIAGLLLGAVLVGVLGVLGGAG
jgi:hypothetical protein